jgi:predicted nucleic acid-binding protein
VTHVYVDASVLLRVVLDEPNPLPEWDALGDPVTSVLAEVEALRTIDRAARKATHPRRKPLTEDLANAARVKLHEVLEMFGRIELEPAMLAQAGRLAGPLGTLDALHLATARALMALGTNQAGDFAFHERLREHPNPFPEHIPVLLLEELANKRRQIHPWFGHRVSTLRVCSSARRTHGTMHDGHFSCLAPWPYRISTTCGDSNRGT